MTRSEIKDQRSEVDLHRKSIPGKKYDLEQTGSTGAAYALLKKLQALCTAAGGDAWEVLVGRQEEAPEGDYSTSNSKPRQINKTFALFLPKHTQHCGFQKVL